MEKEGKTLAFIKHNISQEVPGLFGLDLDLTAPDRTELNLGEFSTTIKLEIGIWLRQQAAQHAEVNEQ
jgi:mediator of RNA polymerase II transcription subunit 12